MRVSFSRITEYRCDIEDDTLKFYRLVTFPQISVHLKEYAFPRLTYLKLSKQGFHGSTTFWLAAILGRCPSLKHLFLDPEDSVRHGICFQHALDHCPLLETLVVAPYAEMPPTILDHQRQIDKDVEETFAESYANNDFKSSSSSNNERNDAERIEAEAATKKQISWDTKRLRRYVVSGHWISYSEGNENDFHDAGYGIMSIFSMNRATLELLYLYFDGYFVNTQALRCLGYAPSLRELRISTENSKPTYEGFRGATSCAQENLDTLFGYCPALEVIVIDINSCIKYFDDEHICRYYNYVTATDTMLKTIATRCPHIQHIKIACPVQYTSLGILNHFTGHDGKDQLAKLTFLEIGQCLITIVAGSRSKSLSFTIKSFGKMCAPYLEIAVVSWKSNPEALLPHDFRKLPQ
ncbi:hypothetical protein BDB00DRAFT_597454 [Zychaea mexicana]|uniref:uncharacterized protein n=1 Tax=Zychaea mexicana TaxID=64656 RepID=UPI0022FE2449|nr:uncharacterized protein BDB00DRAFT_597454 [Zychaea mexicana]KAI9489740.1 hypothetical protein BDB00DRAFT_597454 [Zychaea mexicana]